MFCVYLGRSPVGHQGPLPSAQIPGGHAGVLHDTLVLRGYEPGLCGQWK